MQGGQMTGNKLVSMIKKDSGIVEKKAKATQCKLLHTHTTTTEDAEVMSCQGCLSMENVRSLCQGMIMSNTWTGL